MERQFTIKDFFVFLMLIGLLVSVWFTMIQRDIHWQEVREQKAAIEAIREDISVMRSDMKQIVTEGQGERGEDPRGMEDTFGKLLEVKEMDGYAEGDWFVQSVQSRIENLTPLRSSSAYASQVQGFVLESLIYRDAHDPSIWRPMLAKSWDEAMVEIHSAEWEVTETVDGESKTESRSEFWWASEERPADVPGDAEVKIRNVPQYTFHLRKGLVFADGKPLTAEDVVFSFDMIMNPLILALRERAYYARIWKVEALDSHTVRFTFKEPYFNAFSLAGGIQVMAKHYYGKYVQSPEMATEFNQKKTGELFGSGPYKLANLGSWTPDQPTELVRNDRYWGVKPPLDKLVWKVIKLPAAQLAEFRNGDLDIYGARPVEYEQLKEDDQLMASAQSFEYLSPVAGYLYVAWNQAENGDESKPTWFADKRVRQAMTWMTDRERICKDIYLGYAIPASSPFHPAGEQDNKNIKPRDLNLEKAKALLAEAGFKDTDGDGILEDKNGKPFSFSLIYPSGSPDYKKTILFLKDTYAKAGVEMIPEPLEFNVMLDRIDESRFDAMSLGWTSSFEIDIYQMFHSDMIGDEGDNYMSYRSDELDRLIVEARTEMDKAKRMKLWNRCHEVFYEDQPYTFLFRRKSLVFLNDRFANAKVLDAGYLNWPTYGGFPMEWFVPTDKQRYKE